MPCHPALGSDSASAPQGVGQQCPGPLAVAEVGHVHSQGGGNEQCSDVGLSTAATPGVTGAAGGA